MTVHIIFNAWCPVIFRQKVYLLKYFSKQNIFFFIIKNYSLTIFFDPTTVIFRTSCTIFFASSMH